MTITRCLFSVSVALIVRQTLAFFLLACGLLAAGAINANAACPREAPKLRVTDSAGVLGESASALAAKLADYQAATGHEIAVLLLPSLDGRISIEECAVSVFKQWKLGRKGVDDGVLLLVAVKERKIRIEVGYGLEGSLTDARSSRIVHEIMGPLLARGAYADGIDRAIDAIIASLGPAAKSAPFPLPEQAPQAAAGESGAKAVLGAILVVWLILTSMMGIVGMLVFGIPEVAYAHWIFPDWRGYLFAALIVTAWGALRWRLIRKNVRQFHLKTSGNHTLTWLSCFLAAGLAQPEPNGKSARRRKTASVDDGALSLASDSSDSASDSDSGDSADSGSSSEGGASGGGGASGDY